VARNEALVNRGAWLEALRAHDAAAHAMRELREAPSRRAHDRADAALTRFRRAIAGWTDRQLAALHRKTAGRLQ